MIGHWRPTFNYLAQRSTVGEDCKWVLGVVVGGPFQRELHDSCFFHKLQGERRAAKGTPVEDGWISRVAPPSLVPAVAEP